MAQDKTPMDRLADFFNNRTNPDEEIPEDIRSDLGKWLDENKVTYPTPMQPPWEYAPDIPYGSIGWRMGPGEDYWIAFDDWLMSLPDDQYMRYLSENPEPPSWKGYYEVMKRDAAL